MHDCLGRRNRGQQFGLRKGLMQATHGKPSAALCRAVTGNEEHRDAEHSKVGGNLQPARAIR